MIASCFAISLVQWLSFAAPEGTVTTQPTTSPPAPVPVGTEIKAWIDPSAQQPEPAETLDPSSTQEQVELEADPDPDGDEFSGENTAEDEYSAMSLDVPAPGAPLPGAPPPEDPASIAHRPWQGTMWFDMGLHLAVPLAGKAPAKGKGPTIGGGLSLGARPLDWLGVGAGVSVQIHNSVRLTDGFVSVRDEQRVLFVDIPTLRLFAPVSKVIDPYLELSTGLMLLQDRGIEALMGATGWHASVGTGLDIWAARNVTLKLNARYRAQFVDSEVGHQIVVGLGLGLRR